MPDSITAVGAAGQAAIGVFGWTFKDFSGKDRSSSVNVYGGAPTAAQVTALRTAMGNASNAAIYSQRSTAKLLVDPTNVAVETYDEAYAGVATVAVFVFQELATGRIEYVEIPAPDATLFLADGQTVNAQVASAAAVVTAALAVLNAGGAAFTFQRGFKSGRSERANKPRVVPGTVAEPGVADNPPAGPALPE